jgi:uncharacterized RDD family membrane protein YckC
MQGPDEVRIETPEQIELALEPAGLGSRFVACVVDTLTWAGILFVLILVGAIILASVGGLPAGGWIMGVLGALLGLLVYGFILTYDIVFELRWTGQTPGKRVAGIRVMRQGGGPIDFRSSCIRNLLRPVDWLPAFYLLGALVAAVSRRRQRLGDLAAGTLVIRERIVAMPEDLAKMIEDFASDEFTFGPEHVAACEPGDRHVLRSYFARYGDMDPRARDKLARRLARMFCSKTGYQPPQPLTTARTSETFLASLYRDLDQWAKHGRK